MLQAGNSAPSFDLPDADLRAVSLDKQRGKYHVVLYFYPKDDTPGCTTEACAFQDNLPKFGKSKAVVLGVSVLDEKSKAKFADKHSLTFPLLADEEKAVCQLFDVWKEKSMYGRKYMGVERSTFLIDAKGVLRREWRKVKVPGHAEEVLAAAAEL